MTKPTARPKTLPEALNPFLHDRILGTLFGSALGDAVGLYTEFLTADQSEQAYPERKFTLWPPSQGTPFKRDWHRAPQQLGDWTDDSDHAMLILLSFLHGNGQYLDAHDFASRLQVWVEQGLRALDTLPLGLGQTVGRIVRKPTYLEDPEGTARDVWNRGGRNVAPNGSIMRTHPLGVMCLDKSVEETFRVARDFSVVTHADPRCILSCAVGTALVRGLVRGEVTEEKHIDEMLEAGLDWYEKYRQGQSSKGRTEGGDLPAIDVEELNKFARAQSLSDLQLDEPKSIGYVYKCFGSGLLLLRQAMRALAEQGATMRVQMSLFESLITPLIMEGGDADTNACFAGALLGAFLGYKALPPHWRDGLRHGAWLHDKSEGLCQIFQVGKGSYVGSEDRDTAPDGGRGFLSDKQVKEKWDKLRLWMDQEDKRLEREQRAQQGFMSKMAWS